VKADREAPHPRVARFLESAKQSPDGIGSPRDLNLASL